MSWSRRSCHVLGLAVAVGLGGCSAQRSGKATTSAYVAAESDGTTAAWPSSIVDVCWETDSPGYADDVAGVIRDAVSKEYQRAGVTLSGWALCTAKNSGIRVRVDANDQPHTIQLGKRLAGQDHNMVITFQPLASQLSAGRCGDATSATHCIKTIAMHEFGHAIGLAHEQNRPGGGCRQLDQTNGLGQPDAVAIGQYDATSIMNYCRLPELEALTDAQGWLSDEDVNVIKDMYAGMKVDELTKKYSGAAGQSGATPPANTAASGLGAAGGSGAAQGAGADPAAQSAAGASGQASAGQGAAGQGANGQVGAGPGASGGSNNGCLPGDSLGPDGLCHGCPPGLVLYSDGMCRVAPGNGIADNGPTPRCPPGTVLFTDGYCRAF